jgi:urease accessory protein UreH
MPGLKFELKLDEAERLIACRSGSLKHAITLMTYTDGGTPVGAVLHLNAAQAEYLIDQVSNALAEYQEAVRHASAAKTRTTPGAQCCRIEVQS